MKKILQFMISLIKKYLFFRKLKQLKKKFSEKINKLYEHRLKEYNILLSVIEKSSESDDRDYLLRVWLLALYSNREGYFFETLQCYLDFISWFQIKLYNGNLKSLYLSQKASLQLVKKQKWKEIDLEGGILRIPNIFELNISEMLFKIINSNNPITFWKNIIDTESNVNTKVLRKNFKKIWIKDSYIERIQEEIRNMKFKKQTNSNKQSQDILDDLLDERNGIAHWSKSKVQYSDLKAYHEKILILFNSIKEILQESYNHWDFLDF